MAFITAKRSRRTNYIGIPGTSTFGVGLADEKDYNAVLLEPAERCFDPTDFQYGLYVRGAFSANNPSDHVAMKWIPKFYLKQLQKNEGTVNLDDNELEALLPYVEVTKEQMKEAQRRSPHNALVVAPADRFANEADANAHGFYLMRGFIDGGKEYNGFFIANTLTTILIDKNESKRFIRCGSAKLESYVGNEVVKSDLLRGKYSDVAENITTTGEIFTEVYNAGVANNCLTCLQNTPYQNCSIFAWTIISIISLIQGQYATDTNNCAWYDSRLLINFPKGINFDGLRDLNDSSVNINPAITSYDGDVFIGKQSYNKTTHNGSITGITNVNGWLWLNLLGINGNASKLLKKTSSIYDLNYNNVDKYYLDLFEDFKGSITISKYWGGNKSSFVDLSGDNKDLFGVVGVGDNETNTSSEFGTDNHTIYPGTNYYALASIGDWNNKGSSGIFSRISTDWISEAQKNSHNKGARAMAYPRQQI